MAPCILCSPNHTTTGIETRPGLVSVWGKRLWEELELRNEDLSPGMKAAVVNERLPC